MSRWLCEGYSARGRGGGIGVVLNCSSVSTCLIDAKGHNLGAAGQSIPTVYSIDTHYTYLYVAIVGVGRG